MKHLVLFTVENKRFAIDADSVCRVTWAAEPTFLPRASEKIAGIINIQGQVIPVIKMRSLLGFVEKEIELSDQFIVCSSAHSKCALWVDTTIGILNLENFKISVKDPKDNDLPLIKRVIKDSEGIILVIDEERLVDQDIMHTLTQLT